MESQPSKEQLLVVRPQLLMFGQDLSFSCLFFFPFANGCFSVPLQMYRLGHGRLCSCRFISSVSAEDLEWGFANLLAQAVVLIQFQDKS